MGNSLCQPIGDLRPYLVRVLTPDGDEVNGTGFLCHPDGYVLTCRHVIEGYFRKDPTKVILLYGKERLPAVICNEFGCEQADISVLKMGKLPGPLPYLPLDTHWRVKLKDDLRSFGYPAGAFADGVAIRGQLGGLTRALIDDIDVFPVVGLNIGNIREGYSGAPVVNERTQKVIGLIYAKHKETQAFFTPLGKLFFNWPKLERFHDVYQQLRQHLGQQAERKLSDGLKSAPFISLSLEQGMFPGREQERAADSEETGTQRAAHGRRWKALPLDELLPPHGRNLLSSDVGAGKTTFVHWLATALVSRTIEAVPLVMSCAELKASSATCWSDLRNRLITIHAQQFLEADWADFLEWAHNGRLVFLFDGLDQIKGRDYAELARTAYTIAGDNAALITSRPSAVLVLEGEPAIRLLRLKPFSLDDQRRYFGSSYQDAKKLAQFAPELAQVPMLAYMIRTLVEASEAIRLTTRTEIYQRFVQHILASHEPNRPSFLQERALSRQIEAGLCTLAYNALAEADPQIQRIEENLVFQSISDESLAEELPRFGMVNRILERGKLFFFFTHQSFQEFLAAKYADEHEDAKRRVLAERWSPKWEQVIQFLAGLRGEEIVGELLAGKDNVIHANLFLAASCLPEVKALSAGNLKRIEEGVAWVLGVTPFRKDALEAVGALAFLGEIQNRTQMRRIIKRLGDLDSDVGTAAEKLLGRFGDRLTPPQVDAVVARLGSTSILVITSALRVLGGLGDRLTPTQADSIVARLDDGSPVLEEALWALEGMGDRLTPAQLDAMIWMLGDFEEGVRWTAAAVLRRVSERLTSAQVEAIISRQGNRIAAEALWGLRERLTSAQIETIIANLGDEEEGRREAAAWAMWKLGERLASEQVGAIVDRLGDGDNGVRKAAAMALQFLGDRLTRAQVDAIFSRLSDSDKEVRMEALGALGELRERLTPIQVAQVGDIAARLSNDIDLAVQFRAIRVLGKLGERLTPAQVDALIKRLGDESGFVREDAAEVLQGLGERLTPSQVKDIVSLQGSKEATMALRGLVKKLSPAQVEAIISRLDDKNGKVRTAAAIALAILAERLTYAQVNILFAHLRDRSKEVRTEVFLAIGRLGDQLTSRQIKSLVAHLDDLDERMRRAALQSLGKVAKRLTPAQTDRIVARLSDMDGGVRKDAYDLLKQIYHAGDRLPALQFRLIPWLRQFANPLGLRQFASRLLPRHHRGTRR